MATATAASTCPLSSAFAAQSLDSTRRPSKASPIAGLPVLPKCHVTNSAERREARMKGGGQVAWASAWTALALQAGSAMALVDDRLSTEGTGLSLGVSNPLLIWILLGIVTLIWALYFTSGLPSGDDDSGLSL